MRIPNLYHFFRHQLERCFRAHGIDEPDTVDYVSEMLSRFAHTRSLYAICDAAGRPLEHVVDMLAAHADAQQDRARGNTGRERRIIRHIAEFTLFMSGLFRERVRARGQLAYYEAQGRGAFWHCAGHETDPTRSQVFRHLYFEFAPVADMLHHMRREQLPIAANEDGYLLTALWRS